MAGVILENVSRVFPGGVTAVDRVNLEINDKELLVLVGPSGCGKSTTLRMIAGLERVSAGRITIAGREVNDLAARDRDIAMVFQNYALYPHLSVYKNMAFGLELRDGGGWLRRLLRPAKAADQRSRIDDAVRQASRMLGVETLLGRMPSQLSGGERQRVALGRAIVRQPAAFLLDEPLSNLDAQLRAEMRRELKQLHGRLETTMIYVTHDQVEALTLGQRVAVMHRGAIQQVGSPLDVYDRPNNRFVAGFIGTPPMNFVAGRLTRNAGDLRFERPGYSIPLGQRIGTDGGDVTLGIRAEDVSVRQHAVGSGATHETGSTAGRVTLVEPHGDATFISVCVGESHGQNGFSLVSRAAARTDLREGAAVCVTLDASRAHLFDTVSGVNLALENPGKIA